MKNTIYTLLIGLMLAITVSAFSQDPPPPPNDGLNPSSKNTPVGGGAPIGGGIGILLALGAAYGIKKVYQFNKKENDSSHNF